MLRNLRHGNYKVRMLSHNLLACELIGSFNMEGMQAWVEETRSQIEKLDNTPFYLLIDTRKYAGGTLEALAIADKFQCWLSTTSLIAQAHIIASPVLYTISISQIPSLKYHITKTFRSIDDACVWINEQIENI